MNLEDALQTTVSIKKPLYEIGNTVVHKSKGMDGEDLKGTVVDIKYSFLNKKYDYVVSLGWEQYTGVNECEIDDEATLENN